MLGSNIGLADIAAVTDGNRDNGWGGDGGWWVLIILFALFGWGGNGFGNRGGGEPVTEAGLCNAMNFNGLENAVGRMADEQAAIARQTDNAICNLGYQNAQLVNGVQMQVANEFRGLDNAICTLGFNNQAGFNAIANQMAQCCCDQKQEAAATRFEMAQGFAQLDRTISDQFCQLKMEQKDATIAAMQNELNVANLAASQTAQNQYLVSQLRPCPTPAYITCNPWATNGTAYTTGCGCGC